MYESGETYLETLLVLKNKNPMVRSVDIANELGYSKPSVSRGIGILKEAGYIIVESSGNLNFTQEGLKKANSIYERHQVITSFLIKTLGLEESIAEKDACKMEHIISVEAFNKIKEFLNHKLS